MAPMSVMDVVDDLQHMAAEPYAPLMHRLHLVDGWNPYT